MLKSVSKANSRDLIRRTLLPFHVSRYQQLTKCIRERDEGGDEEMSKKEGGGGGGGGGVRVGWGGAGGEKEKKTCILASPFFCSLLSSLTKSANLPHRHRYAFHMYNICTMVMMHE